MNEPLGGRDAPAYAPLSLPMIAHLEMIPRRYLACFSSTLLFDLAQRRLEFYGYMKPYVMASSLARDYRLSSRWLQATIAIHSPGKQPVPPQTISDWRKRNLLRFTQFDYPEPNSAAALLILRVMDRRRKGWLPSRIEENEPWWWCWRQDSPSAPLLPCPIPLPSNIPHSALLWTPWPGAAWSPPWISIGSLGAMRWAGYNRHEKRWTLSLDELAVWDSELAHLYRVIPQKTYTHLGDANQEALNDLATFALRRRAHEIFT